jgi:hypothetical protein
VLAQAVADLALDLVDVRDDAVEVAVRDDPLGGGLLPDARYAGQVVAGLADHRRDRPVMLRPDAVRSETAAGSIRASSDTPRLG